MFYYIPNSFGDGPPTMFPRKSSDNIDAFPTNSRIPFLPWDRYWQNVDSEPGEDDIDHVTLPMPEENPNGGTTLSYLDTGTTYTVDQAALKAPYQTMDSARMPDLAYNTTDFADGGFAQAGSNSWVPKSTLTVDSSTGWIDVETMNNGGYCGPWRALGKLGGGTSDFWIENILSQLAFPSSEGGDPGEYLDLIFKVDVLQGTGDALSAGIASAINGFDPNLSAGDYCGGLDILQHLSFDDSAWGTGSVRPMAFPRGTAVSPRIFGRNFTGADFQPYIPLISPLWNYQSQNQGYYNLDDGVYGNINWMVFPVGRSSATPSTYTIEIRIRFQNWSDLTSTWPTGAWTAWVMWGWYPQGGSLQDSYWQVAGGNNTYFSQNPIAISQGTFVSSYNSWHCNHRVVAPFHRGKQGDLPAGQGPPSWSYNWYTGPDENMLVPNVDLHPSDYHSFQQWGWSNFGSTGKSAYTMRGAQTTKVDGETANLGSWTDQFYLPRTSPGEAYLHFQNVEGPLNGQTSNITGKIAYPNDVSNYVPFTIWGDNISPSNLHDLQNSPYNWPVDWIEQITNKMHELSANTSTPLLSAIKNVTYDVQVST